MAERNVVFNFVANTSSLLRGTDQATAAMKKMSKAWDESIGKLTGPVASAITGAGLIIAAKKVGEFEEKVRRMGVQANMSSKGILELRQQILSTGLASGNTSDQMTDLAESALRTSKSSKFVTQELGFLAQVMKASGANGSMLGEAMGEIHEKTGLVGKDFESLVQSMYAFGKTTGREATFGQILGNVGPLLEQYKGAGLSTKLEDVNKFLITAMFVPNPATLSRALRTMQTKGQKGLIELGFNMTKGIPAMDKVVERLKKINDVGLRNAYISSIFGPQNLLNIQKLVAEYDAYNKGIKESEKSVQIQKDSAEASKDLSSSLNRISTVGLIIAEKGLAKPLKELGNWMEKLANDPNLDKYIDRITKLAEGFVLLWGTVKAIQAGKAAFNLVTAFGGLFGSAGKPGLPGGFGIGQLGSAMNPMYVIVVSGPAGGGGLPGGGKPGLPGAAGKIATATVIGAVAVGAGYLIGSNLAKGLEEQKKIRDQVNAGKVGGPISTATGLPVGGKIPTSNPLSNEEYARMAEFANSTNVTVNVDGEKVAGVLKKKNANGRSFTIGQGN